MDDVLEINELDALQARALQELEAVNDEAALQAWRVAHLGRNAPLMQIFSRLGQLPKEVRPQVGQRANQVKQALEAALEERAAALRAAALRRALESERLDVTLPGRRPELGRLHPTTRTLRRIVHIFAEMGFQVYRSREVESDAYNFELLNMPAHHPARDLWDTFYTTTSGVLLRTHTSPGQIHVMRERAPQPIRVILPGMCYRYEQISARSEIQFNQVEVLAVGRNITFSDLKGTLNTFARRLFGEQARTRLRPSYFPFTEPSAEMDVECFVCGGKGCTVCKGSGWLEILGCGMVHPTVLQNGGYDPEEFGGFAAGMGVERITMLLHRIEDIRYFWANDVRFLSQF
ncbi:phenylalanine--tRNA ligase subunit alpha [uncultured Thermanaerothrix sp.]|uniref:phenylalanine--tRNA ligase subunit alpha n=1 Tax=uncultured Thermanaerothrix sp. TaxID=1195149 RepID=UPI0026238C94|nr:phenylalanine--tRNA ligase subunit alpha [uncultured Thermanaerothrix sp.]